MAGGIPLSEIIGGTDLIEQPDPTAAPRPRVANLAARGIATPADFPRESPEQYQAAMQGRLQVLKMELEDPETHQNDPSVKAAIGREIADTERKLGRVPGVMTVAASGPAAAAAPQASAKAPTWDDVLAMPEMKSLPHEKLEEARSQYFMDVVAPQVPTEQLRAARAAFDADTKPGVLTRATRAIGEAVDHVKEKGILDWVKQGNSLSPESLDQLERGYRTMKMGGYAHGLTFNRNQLVEVFDRVDRGDKVPEMEDAVGYQHMDPATRQQYRTTLEKSYHTSLNTIVNEAKRVSDLYQNPNASAAIQAANKWEFKEAWKAFMKDPVGIVKDLSLSNAAQIVPMAAGGVVGGAVKGVPGMMIGFASGSFPVDYATSLIDYMNDKGVDLTDYKAVDAKMREPGFIQDMQRYAASHAAGVALADATLGKILKPVTGVGIGGAVKAAAGNVVKSVGTEMAGEATGELLAEGKIKPGDVIAEGLAAGPTSVAGSAAASMAAKRGQGAPTAAPAAAAPPPAADAAGAAPAASTAAGGVLAQGEDGAAAPAVAVDAPAARAPEAVTGVTPMLADADAIFKAAKEKPGLMGTIEKAMRDLPEYKEATPKEQFDLDAAVKSIVADPNEIFRAATARPEILNTIAKAADLAASIEQPAQPAAAAAAEEPSAAAKPDVNAAVKSMTANTDQIFGEVTKRPAVLDTVAAAAAAADKLSKKTKGGNDAGSVRDDAGQVHEGRADGKGSEVQGGGDLQRQAEAGGAASDGQVRRGEDGQNGNQVAAVDAGAHQAATSPQNARPAPSKEQIEAGNAKLGHAKVAGLDLSIENPAGSVRKDLHNTPPKWQTTMQDHYGYVKGTTGFDKDHVDVYVKAGTPEDFSGQVFVVNQKKADGKFDEHKVMIGYPTEQAARAAYQAHYEKGWDRGESVVPMPMPDFKAWAFDTSAKGPKGGAFEAVVRPKRGSYSEIRERRKLKRVAAEASPDVKAAEPWTMTRDAYVDSLAGQRVTKTGFQNRRGTLQIEHQHAVEAAAQTGKPVPLKALMEYPDLERTYPSAFKDARERDQPAAKKEPATAPERGKRKTTISLSRAITPHDVRTAVDPLFAQMGNGPHLFVAKNMADEVIPKAARESVTGTPAAFLHGKMLYMVADQITSRDEAQRLFLRASMGQFGLRKAFHGKLEQTLFDVAESMEKEVRAEAKKQGLDFAKEGDRLQAAEAVLAELAATTPTSTLVKRAIAAIRQALRDLGVKLKLSDNDIIVNLIEPAREHINGPVSWDHYDLPARQPGKGLAPDQVEKQAEQLRSTWENAPDVVVVKDPAALPFKAPEDTRGAHIGDKVYLVASNLHTPAQVQFTLFHEALGHFGLQGVMSEPELAQVYRDISLRNVNVRAAAKEWMASNEKPKGWTDAEYRAQAVEEALADLAGKGETITGLGKLLALVQRWLRSRGFDEVANWLESMTQAEALSVLARARDFVLNGETGEPEFADQHGLAPAFSRYRGRLEEIASGFSKRVDDVLAGVAPGDRPIEIDRYSPASILRVWAKVYGGKPADYDLPLMMQPGILGESEMRGSAGGEKARMLHGLPIEAVKQIPAQLARPLLIYRHSTQDGVSLRFITDLGQGKPIAIAVRAGQQDQGRMVNKVMAILPLSGGWDMLADRVRDLVYKDTTKLGKLPENVRKAVTPGSLFTSEQSRRGDRTKGTSIVLTQADLVNLEMSRKLPPADGGGDGRGGAPSLSRAPAASEHVRKAATYRQVATRVIDRIDRALDPILALPDRDAYLKARHVAQGIVDNVGDLGRSIYDTFAKATPEDGKAAYEYLTTKDAKPDAIKDAGIRAHAVATKTTIDGVGQELVKRGLLAPETFEENRGAYLPRVYLKHMLEARDWARIGSGRKPSQMGYLKQRKDIPAEVRDILLGEIKDPGYLSAVGFTRAMRDMALIDWLSQISKNGQWVLPKSLVVFNGHKVTPYWLKTEATRLRAQSEHMEAGAGKKATATADAMDKAAAAALAEADADFDAKQWKQIPDTARYGRLRGLVVRKEIFDDIVGIGAMVPADAGWAEKLLGYGGLGTKATQLWKASKVSLNPPSQIRNFVSNAVLLQLSGVPMHRVPQRMAQAARAISTNGTAWQIAKKHGLKASTFSAQELFNIEREMLSVKLKNSGAAWLHLLNVGAKVLQFAGDWYQKSEALFKTAKIIDEMARGKAAEDAVLEANKWLFDYSRVSPSIRYLRNAPIGAPFITFMAKVAPRLVEVALKHPQRYLPYAVMAWGIPMVVASMLGVGTDDLDKLKKLLPEAWQQKGHVYVLPYKDEHGRWQVLDLSYFMPWAQFDQMGRQLVKGDIVGATKSAGVFGGPIPDIITAWKTNKDPFTGREIVKKGAPPALQIGGLLTYALDMAMPPWLSSKGMIGLDFGDPNAPGFLAGKAVRALEGNTNKAGDPVVTPAQAAAAMVGVNVRGVDPKMDRASILQQAARGIGDTRTELKRSMEDRSLSPAQREHAKGIYVDEMKSRTDKLRKLADDTKLPPALQ